MVKTSNQVVHVVTELLYLCEQLEKNYFVAVLLM